MAVKGFNENKEAVEVFENEKIVVRTITTEAIADGATVYKSFSLPSAFTLDNTFVVGVMYKYGSNNTWYDAHTNITNSVAKILVMLTPGGQNFAGQMKLTRNFVSTNNIAFTVRLMFMRKN